MKLSPSNNQQKAGGLNLESKLRGDVSPTISKAGRMTIPKHHQFLKGKFEGDDYKPIKMHKIEPTMMDTASNEDDDIEKEFHQ